MSSAFGIASLKIPGVIDITLEMSIEDRNGNPLLQKRMDEVNAMLRFQHKISNPQWEMRTIGSGSSTPKKAAKKAAPKRPAETPKPEPVEPPPVQNKPMRPNRPVPVEREGSIEGTVDIAAARRLARS